MVRQENAEASDRAFAFRVWFTSADIEIANTIIVSVMIVILRASLVMSVHPLCLIPVSKMTRLA
ncbi:hypothetical protein ASD54_01280 [Rhizobium sp. Root149]|nr:hypothetical protein ASD54_01280 [Rhizobium sp. Root149]